MDLKVFRGESRGGGLSNKDCYEEDAGRDVVTGRNTNVTC